MTDLIYSQRDGFQEFELSAEHEWRKGESDREWLARIGYDVEETRWALGDWIGKNREHAIAYERAEGSAESLPRYVVCAADFGGFEYVFVSNAGDLMDLRLRLASHLAMIAIEDVTELRDYMGKALRIMHPKHDPEEACWECDPHGKRLQERARMRAQLGLRKVAV